MAALWIGYGCSIYNAMVSSFLEFAALGVGEDIAVVLFLAMRRDIFDEVGGQSLPSAPLYIVSAVTRLTDDTLEDARSMLTEYLQTAAAGMNIVSRQTMVEQYEAETLSAAVTGYAVSAVIALVGLLNFVNSMVTAILSRKREFAMIQSIGMTKYQLRSMLTLEGLYYAGLTLIASCVLSAVTVGVVVRSMVGNGFSTFRFTLFPLAVCTPLLLLFAVLLPYLCFQNLEKQSIVERLRTAD